MNKNAIIVVLGVAVVAITAGHFWVCKKWTNPQSDKGKMSEIEIVLKNVNSKLSNVETILTNNAQIKGGNDKEVEEIKTTMAELERSVKVMTESMADKLTGKETGIQAALEAARKADSEGDHAMAALYWQNALEHSDASNLLQTLKEYSESVFKFAEGDFSRYDDAVVLERLAAVAIVKVSADDIPAAKELHTRCAKFRDSLLAIENEDVEVPDETVSTAVNPVDEMVNAVESIIKEMQETIDTYVPGSGEKPADAEYKILQLSGVAENTMSQIWLLDRSGLSEELRKTIDSFPARLNTTISNYNTKHDYPILASIRQAGTTRPPRNSDVVAACQYNIDFFTKQIAQIAEKAKTLRGTPAQEEAQKIIAMLQTRVVDERRQQMNQYQQFVANCCKLAFDSWDDVMNTGSAGYGRLPKNKGFKDENDFILRYVRPFASQVPMQALQWREDRRSIYAADNLIAEALQRKSGGPNYWDVKNEQKAFIVTAIYGLYRIDQSLLTPETSRLFNDVWGKYYDKMDSTRKVWSVRWMVEEPKIRLEDF